MGARCVSFVDVLYKLVFPAGEQNVTEVKQNTWVYKLFTEMLYLCHLSLYIVWCYSFPLATHHTGLDLHSLAWSFILCLRVCSLVVVLLQVSVKRTLSTAPSCFCFGVKIIFQQRRISSPRKLYLERHHFFSPAAWIGPVTSLLKGSLWSLFGSVAQPRRFAKKKKNVLTSWRSCTSKDVLLFFCRFGCCRRCCWVIYVKPRKVSCYLFSCMYGWHWVVYWKRSDFAY